MPLIDIRHISEGKLLGRWRISEPFDGTPRQRERHAVQQLLTAMTDDPDITVGHEASGKPYIVAPHPTHFPNISISHTRGYAAVLLTDAPAAGVDIEYRSDRVESIATRFIRPDEAAETTDEKLVLWSAKETVYKLFSEDRLLFHDMRMVSMDTRLLRMENMKRKTVVDVFWELTDDYVLTFATLPA